MKTSPVDLGLNSYGSVALKHDYHFWTQNTACAAVQVQHEFTDRFTRGVADAKHGSMIPCTL